MKYAASFKAVTELKTFIGTGCPNSKILVVGKEVATNTKAGIENKLENDNTKSFKRNYDDWIKNMLNSSDKRNF